MFNRLRLGAFVKVHRFDRWLRGRFTAVGRALLGTLVAVALFALNPRITQAWLLAIVLLTLLMVAMGQAAFFRPRVRLRRHLPACATVGHDVHYQLLIANQSRRTLPAVKVRERPPRLRVRDLLEGEDKGRLVLGIGRAGYPRFMRFIRLRDGFLSERGCCAELAPGRRMRVGLSLMPTRRGYLSLTRLCLERVDPLGIFRAWREHPLRNRLLVLPRRFPLRWQESSGHNKRLGSGRAQSSATGGNVEFARLREYRPGDSMRHIHWRASAHLQTPVVMEFHQQAPGRSALILDTFVADPLATDVFEEAVSVAASFCGDTGWCDGRLELLLLGEQSVHLGCGPSGGTQGNGIDAMLEALACVQPARSNTPELLANAARRELEGIEQCICVFLDYDSVRQELLRDLQLMEVNLLVLVVHADAHHQIRRPGLMAGRVQQLVAIAPGEAAQVLLELPFPQRYQAPASGG